MTLFHIRADGAFDAVLLAALMVVVDPNISSAQDGNSPVEPIGSKTVSLPIQRFYFQQYRFYRRITILCR